MNTLTNNLKRLTKKQLTQISKLHRMTGYSTLNKNDLAEKLGSYISDSEYARDFFSYFDKDEIAFYISKKNSLNPFISKRLFDTGYCFKTSSEQYFCSESFSETFLLSKEFQKEQRKRSHLLDCFTVAGFLYGCVTLSVIKKLFESSCSFSIKESEIARFYEEIPDYFRNFTIKDGLYVHHSFINEDLYEKILLCQKSLPYYIPSAKEITFLAHYGFINDSHTQKLIDYLLKQQVSEYSAMLQTSLLQSVFRQGGSIHDALKALSATYEDTNITDKIFLSYVNEMFIHTRQLLNRGYTTAEKTTLQKEQKKIYPNSPCPCGSGKKYKNCCKNVHKG